MGIQAYSEQPSVVVDLADLEDDVVPGREHVVELVRVDLEQDRGHSNCNPSHYMILRVIDLSLRSHSKLIQTLIFFKFRLESDLNMNLGFFSYQV